MRISTDFTLGKPPANAKTFTPFAVGSCSGFGKHRLMGAPQPRSAQAGVGQTPRPSLERQSRFRTSDLGSGLSGGDPRCRVGTRALTLFHESRRRVLVAMAAAAVRFSTPSLA